mmetsp:Transcript_34074/g.61195  ORF Transcript_34074/g.61195 Transcript_34074/m.61195 type:complete len:206 (-) Transcript_34074:294-911(-)
MKTVAFVVGEETSEVVGCSIGTKVIICHLLMDTPIRRHLTSWSTNSANELTNLLGAILLLLLRGNQKKHTLLIIVALNVLHCLGKEAHCILIIQRRCHHWREGKKYTLFILVALKVLHRLGKEAHCILLIQRRCHHWRERNAHGRRRRQIIGSVHCAAICHAPAVVIDGSVETIRGWRNAAFDWHRANDCSAIAAGDNARGNGND